MRGHIVAEDRFLHQGIDHHLFVTGIEAVENEYRFEVTRVPPGGAVAETVFEKLIDFSAPLAQDSGTSIDQLIATELIAIKSIVNADEDLHVHDP
jgi:hypothetical protein